MAENTESMKPETPGSELSEAEISDTDLSGEDLPRTELPGPELSGLGSCGIVINLKDYRDAYHYFAAAGKVYDRLNRIYESVLDHAEFYRITADIVRKEFKHIRISSNPGHVRRHFAGAQSGGFPCSPASPLSGCQKVYLICVPAGAGLERMLNVFLDSAVHRGFLAEGYYCPTKPEARLMHLIIPDLGVGFITCERHQAIPKPALKAGAEVVTVDLKHAFQDERIAQGEKKLRIKKKLMDELLDKGFRYLRRAMAGSRNSS